MKLRHWYQYHGGYSWTPGNKRWNQVAGRRQCLRIGYSNLPWMTATQQMSYGKYIPIKIIESLNEISEISKIWYQNF